MVVQHLLQGRGGLLQERSVAVSLHHEVFFQTPPRGSIEGRSQSFQPSAESRYGRAVRAEFGGMDWRVSYTSCGRVVVKLPGPD